MLTSEQIDDLREQAEQIFDAAGYGTSQDTIANTRETIADFQAVWGEGKVDRDIELPNRVWHDVQKNGKGTGRGTLVVIDFGEIRIANFC
jgi:hypothetical protein